MMKTLLLPTSLYLALLLSSLLVSGCSDDTKTSTTPTQTKTLISKSTKGTHNPNPFDHSDDRKVTALDKEHFEKAFAEQCISRETVHSVNKEHDQEQVAKPCHCIARFMMKDLTGEEAEKFLAEHENPQSLRIKYENAAYHCLQQNTPPLDHNFLHQKR